MQLLFHRFLLAVPHVLPFSMRQVSPVSFCFALCLINGKLVAGLPPPSFNFNRDHEIKHLRMFIGSIDSPDAFHRMIRSPFEHR